MSRTETWARFPYVEGVSIEDDSGDGLWAYYKPGWKSGSDPLGCVHSDHEDTVGELIDAIVDAIPCDCGECTNAKD